MMIALSTLLAMQILIPDRVNAPVERREARFIESEFARCVVLRHPADARKYVLAESIDEKTRSQIRQKLSDGNCLDNVSTNLMMTIPSNAMRSMLAQALVQAQFAGTSLGDLEMVAPLARPEYSDDQFQPKAGKQYNPAELRALAEQRAQLKAGRFLSIFGECVVRMDQANALVLLKTSPTSSAEAAAIAALNPAMGQCIPEGQSLALNTESIRGNVAENYYRLAVAPRVAPVSKAAQ